MGGKFLIGVFTLGSVTAAGIYLSKTHLDQLCRRVSISNVSPYSACRLLLENAHISSRGLNVPQTWGKEDSGLLLSWPASEPDCHQDIQPSSWIPSLVALQIKVPVSLLAGYRPGSGDISTAHGSKTTDGASDVDSMARNFVTAFLRARTEGLDGYLLDKDVPPLSFAPGTHLFGVRDGMSASVLGTWGSRLRESMDPSSLPRDAPTPSSAFPSNETVFGPTVSSDFESAGVVIYWKFPARLVQLHDLAASYGVPWRLIDGGFQEFIVEKISDDLARVTYIPVECAKLHPIGQSERDFKSMPRVAYETHVMYAQSLLLRAVRQLERHQLE